MDRRTQGRLRALLAIAAAGLGLAAGMAGPQTPRLTTCAGAVALAALSRWPRHPGVQHRLSGLGLIALLLLTGPAATQTPFWKQLGAGILIWIIAFQCGKAPRKGPATDTSLKTLLACVWLLILWTTLGAITAAFAASFHDPTEATIIRPTYLVIAVVATIFGHARASLREIPTSSSASH